MSDKTLRRCTQDTLCTLPDGNHAEHYDCRDGLTWENYGYEPPGAAVPEAEDGRGPLSEDEQGAYLRGWRDGQGDASAARDDERERLAAVLAAIDYDDDAWDKQHSATWNYREWLDRIDAAAAPIRAVLAAAPLPEGQEGDR